MSAEIEYYQSFERDGLVASVDMLRASFRIERRMYEDVRNRLDTLPSDEKLNYYESRKPGGYRSVYAYSDGGASWSVGIGWNEPGKKVNERKGFIEYNPNKAGSSEGLAEFARFLRRKKAKFELKRFDLAVDVPIERRNIILVKDSRRYESIVSGSITQYLGTRNRHGRVKVYDKAKESDLKVPLTRVELTLDGDSTVEDACEVWPTLIRLLLGDDLPKGDRLIRNTAALVAAYEYIEALGGDHPPIEATLSRKTCIKVRRLQSEYDTRVQAPRELMAEVLGWLDVYFHDNVAGDFDFNRL